MIWPVGAMAAALLLSKELDLQKEEIDGCSYCKMRTDKKDDDCICQCNCEAPD